MIWYGRLFLPKSDQCNIKDGRHNGHCEHFVITSPPEKEVVSTIDLCHYNVQLKMYLLSDSWG